jgi:cell division protein FtsL
MAIALRKPVNRSTVSRPPALRVVEIRRRMTRLVVFTATVVAAGLGMLAVIHTQIASRQTVIDQLDRAIAEQNDRFDTLRAVRAELRAPVRLDQRARELGMAPAVDSSFLSVDPLVLAMAMAATSGGDSVSDVPDYLGPLDQFRMVKIMNGLD